MTTMREQPSSKAWSRRRDMEFGWLRSTSPKRGVHPAFLACRAAVSRQLQRFFPRVGFNRKKTFIENECIIKPRWDWNRSRDASGRPRTVEPEPGKHPGHQCPIAERTSY